MPDEHASEFADTLAGLKSGKVETSDSDKTEFADIVDEEEVEEEEAKERYRTRLILGLLFFWLILDAESLFDVVFFFVF